ncbi:ABC transporter G family member 9-like [Hyalella azteca]|uniref:ABC transporter G family member 9-like n=1 Tax=Hyalella azteca TaxID=294128 RepID=A0A979FVD9_HYAAZ|nr:ABC transporter G family member 9-like [Hyalella azteca]
MEAAALRGAPWGALVEAARGVEVSLELSSPDIYAALCLDKATRLGEWRCRGGGLSVRWSGVSVSVAGKTLVSELSGHCDPGHIFAVMGPSGSGKTTLLNALSGRVRCEGSVWLGERPLSRKLRHLVGYSTQHDLFHPHLRLRQMLQFTAELRLPHAMSQAQKAAAVDAVIDLLGLQHCQHTIIGDASVRGLSGGERKRASIACELLTDPPVLLLDEPTSGLDAHAAHSLITNLKALAVQEGRAVVLSLHQPSSRIFHMLDTVLLLAKGQPAYLGPSEDVAPYLAQLGLPIQPNYNPADFLRGSKHVPCGPCDGSKHVPCGPCDGSKHVPCGPFNGSKHVPCGPFNGSKHVPCGPFDGSNTCLVGPSTGQTLEVATEHSERLIRHHSETHRAGTVVRQSKNPPPNVVHQRLSSLSASQSKQIQRTYVHDEDASSSHERLDVGQELPEYRDLQYSRLTNANGYPRSVVIDVPDECLTQRSSNVQRCACGNVVQLSLDVLPSVDSEHHSSEIINSPYSIDLPSSSTVRVPSDVAVSNPDYESSVHLFVCDDYIKVKNHQHLIHAGHDRDSVDPRGGLDLVDDDSEHDHDLQRSSSFRGFNVTRSLPAPLSEDACLNKGPGRPADETQWGALPDTRTTTPVKRDESDSGRESCISDHSDEASCSAASVAAFASSRRRLRLYAADARWPASYWTQCRVLTARCFTVSRPIITSRVNWVQTLGFALLAGVLWYQAPRTEEGITDLQGWMFFSASYWMMHSHFQALSTFPREKAVLEKERGSCWYRISAYYIAKTLSELPLTIALPSLYFIISYPLMAGVSNALVMLLLLLMLLLNAIVAQSMGLLVSVTFSDIEHCWAVSALITLFQQLFGGFLSTRVPPWMEWARYLSMVQYAYTNMCYIEFSMGLPVACAAELSRYPSCASGNSTVVPVAEILDSTGVFGSSMGASVIWMNTAALVLYLVVARLLTYLVLRYRYRPKYL